MFSIRRGGIGWAGLGAALVLSGWQLAAAAPLGSAFSYQGQLKESGQPANGLYDLQACLFDDQVNPVPLACSANFDDVPVEEGVFSVVLDFGTTPFAGEQRFLELRVRPGASSGAYTFLAPRQLIRPAPEALRAAAASAAPWSGLSGVPAGFADGIDDGGTGTVTSVASGTGLTGGPITGSGTLAIATAGVGTAQLANDAVDASKLAANAVDTAALVDANVTTGKIADDAISAAKLANNAVDTAAIVDANVTRAKIAPGAVGLAQIDTGQVQERISGVCPQGTYLVAIGSGGSLLCLEQPGIGVTTTVDDPANNVGFDISIAMGADRMPVIAYFDDSADALKVAKCANPACTGTATITTVDDPRQQRGRAHLDRDRARWPAGDQLPGFHRRHPEGRQVREHVLHRRFHHHRSGRPARIRGLVHRAGGGCRWPTGDRLPGLLQQCAEGGQVRQSGLHGSGDDHDGRGYDRDPRRARGAGDRSRRPAGDQLLRRLGRCAAGGQVRQRRLHRRGNDHGGR